MIADESWSARRIGDAVRLERTHECVACCKRKRHACPWCGGTGRRTVEHEITLEAAIALDEALAVAIRTGASAGEP